MERYKDKQLSAYERAAALADTLSTEEQAQQLKYDAPAIEKAGLPSYNWWNEGLHYVMTKEGGPVVFEGNSEHCFQDQQGHILRLRKAFPAFAQALDQQLAAGQEA